MADETTGGLPVDDEELLRKAAEVGGPTLREVSRRGGFRHDNGGGGPGERGAGPRKRGGPPTTPPMPGQLTVRETLFVRAYLGVARTNATRAARLAGYKGPESAGYRLTRRKRVQQMIYEGLQVQAEAAGLDADTIIEHVLRVMHASRSDYATLKAAELLSKLKGFFAPQTKRHEHVLALAASGYAELARSLEAGSAGIKPELRARMIERIEEDVAAAQRALAILRQTHRALPAEVIGHGTGPGHDLRQTG